jgi:hypothetical protein
MSGKQVKTVCVENRLHDVLSSEGGIAAWVFSVKPNSFENPTAFFSPIPFWTRRKN